MATLTIRDLPDEVRNKLRVRAAEHGRSMEAEVREVLSTTVGNDPSRAEHGVRRRIERSQSATKAFHGRAMTESVTPASQIRTRPSGEDTADNVQSSQQAKLERARTLLRAYVPEGSALVDEFLAERRAMWGDD